MHGSIIELNREPITPDDWKAAEDIQENNLFDYVDDCSADEREKVIKRFSETYSICKEEDALVFTSENRKTYLEGGYKEFREIIGKLQNISLEEYVGENGEISLLELIGKLDRNLEDFTETYIIDQTVNGGEPVTLSKWYRMVSLPATYHVCAVLDYHI